MTYKGEATIYGILREKDKSFYLESIFGYNIPITPCPTLRGDLGRKAGLEFSLHGMAEWQLGTSNIVSYEVYDWDYHRLGNTLETLEEIKKIGTNWDNYNTQEDINEVLLKDKKMKNKLKNIGLGVFTIILGSFFIYTAIVSPSIIWYKIGGVFALIVYILSLIGAFISIFLILWFYLWLSNKQ